MFMMVDERALVANGYVRRFGREGFALVGFCERQFVDWVDHALEGELRAVEAFLIGNCPDRENLPRLIRRRSQAPVIALNDAPSLERTLALFRSGADDVVRNPVHFRELLARIGAVRRRVESHAESAVAGPIEVFFDGREPRVDGAPLDMPRRERRILEYLVVNKGRRATREQIFNSVYGILDCATNESVVECHISKLRKRLQSRLGYNPIDCQRHIGYVLEASPRPPGVAAPPGAGETGS